RLERAIELYSGPLLRGMEQEWIGAERRRLAALHSAAVLELSQLRSGDPAGASEVARRAPRPPAQDLITAALLLITWDGTGAAGRSGRNALPSAIEAEVAARGGQTLRSDAGGLTARFPTSRRAVEAAAAIAARLARRDAAVRMALWTADMEP